MTTILTPVRVTAEDIPDNLEREDLEYLQQGLEEAFANGAITKLEEAVRRHDNHPSLLAFQDVLEDASAEVAAECATLMREAIRRRLPWTWEPKS